MRAGMIRRVIGSHLVVMQACLAMPAGHLLKVVDSHLACADINVSISHLQQTQ